MTRPLVAPRTSIPYFGPDLLRALGLAAAYGIPSAQALSLYARATHLNRKRARSLNRHAGPR